MKNVKDYLKLNYDISKPIKKWYGDFKITFYEISFYYHSGNKFSEEILIGLPKEITGDFYFWIGSEASSELISYVTELIKKLVKFMEKLEFIKNYRRGSHV
jgi:hypothetical protein